MKILQQIIDENGNVIYEEHDSGYFERNQYNENGKLIRSEQHYPNGIVEIEHFSDNEVG